MPLNIITRVILFRVLATEKILAKDTAFQINIHSLNKEVLNVKHQKMAANNCWKLL
jgi:hypothetical protein